MEIQRLLQYFQGHGVIDVERQGNEVAHLLASATCHATSIWIFYLLWSIIQHEPKTKRIKRNNKALFIAKPSLFLYQYAMILQHVHNDQKHNLLLQASSGNAYCSMQLQHPCCISPTISSIKSLQMWSCRANPILPISLLFPQSISLHTSSTLSIMALLLHMDDIIDPTTLSDPFLSTTTVSVVILIILSWKYIFVVSSSPGFFLTCFWCCCCTGDLLPACVRYFYIILLYLLFVLCLDLHYSLYKR